MQDVQKIGTWFVFKSIFSKPQRFFPVPPKQNLIIWAGDLEADGTSIRKWRDSSTGKNVYYQIFALFQRGSEKICKMHEMSFASAKAYGKPPPESFQRVDQTQAFDKVDAYDTRGYKTSLITDGAPAYKKLKKKYKLLLAHHAQGIFSYTKKIGARKKVKVHTGGVDGFWNIMKKGVPKSLPSKSTKKLDVSPKCTLALGKLGDQLAGKDGKVCLEHLKWKKKRC